MKILTWGPNTIHWRLGLWWQLVGFCCKSSLSLVYILKKERKQHTGSTIALSFLGTGTGVHGDDNGWRDNGNGWKVTVPVHQGPYRWDENGPPVREARDAV